MKEHLRNIGLIKFPEPTILLTDLALAQEDGNGHSAVAHRR